MEEQYTISRSRHVLYYKNWLSTICSQHDIHTSGTAIKTNSWYSYSICELKADAYKQDSYTASHSFNIPNKLLE